MSQRMFYAAVYSVETGEEKNLATFYLMNTTVNRNGWGVTDKALEEALTTILRKSIGCGPEYRVDQHYPEPMQVGHFIRSEKPDGYALGTAEITDGTVWENLTSGKWGPISVVILSYRESCSFCGEELTGLEEPFEHKCIQEKAGFLLVESFVFDRVDFVDVPAYPQAGYVCIAAQQPVSLELLAGFYEGNSQSTGQAQGSPGKNPDPELEKRKNMSETEQLQEQIQELQAKNTELVDSKKGLEARVEQLEEELESMLLAIHNELAEEVLQARIKAGLVEDQEEERDTLRAIQDEVLESLLEDAHKVRAKLDSLSTKPKAKYAPVDSNQLKAAIDEARARLFGQREDH
jgi:hypothetical protein